MLAAVVATLGVWLSVEAIRARRQRAVVRAIWGSGGYVARLYERPAAEALTPGWYRTLFGDDFMDPVVAVRLAGTDVGDDDLIRIGKLKRLQMLDLRDTRISDAGLRHLRGLRDLKLLVLTGTKVSDRGLSELENMPQLEVLCLEETKITDAGLQQLGGLANLKWLNVSGNQITDAGLACLRQFPLLEVLIVDSCPISQEGARELERALPSTIVSDGTSRRPSFQRFCAKHFEQ